MLIKRRPSWSLPESEVTDEQAFLNRRQFLKAAGYGTAALTLPLGAFAEEEAERQVLKAGTAQRAPQWLASKVAAATPGGYSTSEDATPWEYITGYNNFYEFGTGKTDPKDNAQDFVTDPWSVEIVGEAEVTGKFALEDIMKPHDLEERIYRLRCVEAWSMVVPWIGFPLGDLLKRFKPTADAKYVKFETLFDPNQMPGQRSFFSGIEYPYVEGLRIDEAMNELSFMAVGVYGQTMPPQNGAPLRLVVPWKYGFKSIKSIVKIMFLKRQPRTTWEISQPREYGFYANVNPTVDHPRWSQASERRLPSSLFEPNRIDTLMFNGYGEQVAGLYTGMNLRRNF